VTLPGNVRLRVPDWEAVLLDKLRVGVIGMGGRGRYLAKAFGRNPRSSLVAVADPDAQALKMCRRLWGDEVGYHEDYVEMLRRPDIDTVIIASPDHAHHRNAVDTLNHGKHLLLEKPMAQTVEQCDEIIEAWKRAGTVFMIGLELRHCVLFERMWEIIDEGAVGEIKLGWAIDNVSVGGQYFYHDKQRRKEYTRSLLLQKGVHTIDLLNWFMAGRPTRVFGIGGLNYYGGTAPNDKRCRDCEKKATCPFFMDSEKFVMDYGATIQKDDLCVYAEEIDLNDNSMLTIDYDNGTRGVYVECHFTPEYTREFTLVGTRGKMYGLYNNEGNFLIRCSYRHTDHIDEWRPVFTGGGHGGGDQRIQEHFLDCVLAGKQPVADIVAARDSTAVGAAGEESIETGLPIAIEPCPWA